MATQGFAEVLFRRIWWSYDRDLELWYSTPYHWFNLVEGCIWLIVSAFVLARYARCRRSYVELLYAAAFVSFAISDFREAWQQSSGLIWFKILNLIALVALRRHVMRRYYPAGKVY